MKVVIYARVSTRDQKLEAQLEELRKYCRREGFEIVGEQVDHGYSGGSDDRPGLQQVLQWIREGYMDAIIITKLDRLFRSVRHLVNTVEELIERDIGLIAVRDSINLTTPTGRLLVQLLGVVAEFELALIRERIKSAQENGVKLGRKITRPQEAIVTLRRAGWSYRAIMEAQNCSMGAVCRAIEVYEKEKENPYDTTSQN